MNICTADDASFSHPSHSRSCYRTCMALLTALVASAGLQFGISRTASAADADTDTTGLQQVVVTASRVALNAQTVPMSITPITAATLEQAGALDFQDYVHMAPSVTYSYSFGAQGVDVAIRGIQGTGTTAFYIDDLPIDQILDPKLLNDVDRIEVLRGPQGTLYGARSMGGAVRTITIAPDTEKFSGGVAAQGTTYGDGNPGYQMDGFLNIPLVEGKLALRISAYDGSSGPFINRQWLKNPADAVALAPTNLSPSVLQQHPLTGTMTARNDYYGGMASLLWTPVDGLSVRATYMAQVNNYNGWPTSDFQVPATPPGVEYTGPYTANSLTQTRTFDIPEYDNLKWWLAGLTINYQTAIGQLSSATGYVRYQSSNVEDITEWTHNVVLPSVPEPPPTVGPPVPPFRSSIYSFNDQHSFVEELRFVSKPLGPVQFVTGLYFFRQDATSEGQNWVVPGINAASGGAFGTDVGYYANGTALDHENAIYGELTYHFTSKFSGIVGYRYSHVETGTNLPWSGFIVYPTTGGGGNTTQDVTTPKFALQYQATPNVMYYALASKGFRPGNGQVAPPPNACAQDYTDAGLTVADLSSFGSDSLWNYEVGAKTQTMNNKLQVNVSAYDIDWKNIQQTSRFQRCGFVFTVNAGAATSRGAELSIAAAPARGLQLTATLSYDDAKLTASTPESEPVGSPVQQIAPWNASFAVDYTVPVTQAWNAVFRADYSYTDRSYSANNPPFLRLRPAYDLVNLRAGMQSDRWEYQAFIQNVTNATPNLGDSASEAGEDPGRARIFTLPPRTYGLRVAYKF